MVIDSHTLVWWLEAPALLSRTAKRWLAQLDAGEGEFMVSSVTFWEMRLKEGKGKFEPKTPVRHWPALLTQMPNLTILPTTTEVWLLGGDLDWSHKDPADRIIAATALHHGVPVLTKDRVFHKAGCQVEAVW